ncbi:hypothetical protein PP175_03910 [Aneurinibacillus sp. Ricciae_BoGa-3]|uniref:hypothetical protein n=1 Tax=Aneurinibacillus sp. Ricciae_BoGa-3 TaxID=3022697 RepID=UPI002340EBD2|nr:hypothetical protein [Aneurinibacillus sp. Ricciae_BoGa-3]WCK55142.1 hypothetical protein PP175_03910 [Aneurinibacillus sp. Ricciae_BoGa-3]
MNVDENGKIKLPDSFAEKLDGRPVELKIENGMIVLSKAEPDYQLTLRPKKKGDAS